MATDVETKTDVTEEKKTTTRKPRAKKAPTTEVKPVEENKDQELELLKSQIEMYKKQMNEMMETMQKMQQPQVITVPVSTEKVHFLWQAEVADDNKVMFGQGGRLGSVTGKRGEFYVPKSEFTSMMDEQCRWFMDKRWLIVLDGLTEDEREAYGVNYKDGEYLDREAFRKIIEMGDKILEIYPNLCEGNKIMVAQRYLEAYQKNSPLVNRETVIKLNEMSKDKKCPRGYFIQIIEGLNRELEGN